MRMIRIRFFEQKDIDRVWKMEQNYFSEPWSKAEFEALLTREYCIYVVAELDDLVVGFAGMTNLCGEGDIDKVMVDENYRGMHIAGQMLRELFAIGEKKGIESYTLEVRVGNAPAIALYEHAGFVNEGIRPNFYTKPTEDAMIMWKRK